MLSKSDFKKFMEKIFISRSEAKSKDLVLNSIRELLDRISDTHVNKIDWWLIFGLAFGQRFDGFLVILGKN